MSRGRLVVALGLLLAPGVALTPVWLNGGLGAGEDDVLYYYPSRQFFHESIRRGEWPAYNPLTGLGRPYAADPQSALWYPFTWLFAAVTPKLAYPASLWLHYSIASWGMYRMLRALRVGRPAAVLGGLLFALSGFMVAHRAHFAMQHAAAWTPWVLWRLQRLAEAGGARRLVYAAIVTALQAFAGHVQIAAVTGLGALVYLAAASPLRRAALTWGATWALAAGLYAVQWLPTAAYLRHCTRVENDYRDFTENSWHPASAVGLLAPMLLGQRAPNWFDQPWWGPSHQVEQFVYPGLLPLALAALAVRAGWRSDRRRRGLVVLGLFAVLLALGRFGPVCPLLYWIPGSSLFRVPARAMVLFNLALAGLAALTLNDLCAPLSPQRVRLRSFTLAWTKRPILLALCATAAPLVAVLLSLPLTNDATRRAALAAVNPVRPAVWVPLAVALLSLFALRKLAAGWQARGPVWPIMGVVLLDLAIIGWSIDVPPDFPGVRALLDPPRRAQWLQHVRGSPHRLWVVADTKDIYDDPVAKGVANTNVLVGLASLTDYGPLQPSVLRDRFAFSPWGASDKTRELLSDTSWMRPFDVGWVLLCDPSAPPPAGCVAVTETSDGWRLYRHPVPAGAAFVEHAVTPVPSARGPTTRTAARVDVQFLSPTHIVTRVTNVGDAPQRLVLSRLALPGWTARCTLVRPLTDLRPVTGTSASGQGLEGQDMRIESAYGGLLSVTLPAGVDAVDVEWRYQTPMLAPGAAVSLASLVLLVAAWTGRRNRR